MSTHSDCLNCGNHLSGAFCQHCGQSATTHRFSLSHIFAHDFIHAIFHVHRGFFFTIKELFVRPGHMTREFIEGKRARYFNYFTLLVIVIAAGHFISQFSTIQMSDIMGTSQSKGFMDKFEKFTKEYPRIYTFTTIPLVAFFSFIFFRRAKQNYAEHLVLNAYKACGELLIGITLTILIVAVPDITILRWFYTVFIFVMIGYSTRFYFQYFSVYGYSKSKLIFLSLLSALSISLLTFILTIVFMVIYGMPKP